MTGLKRGRREPWTCALITGASSGIGAGFARVLGAECDLVLTARATDALETVKQEIQRAHPMRAVTIVPADLTEPDGRAAVGAAAEGAGVDLLVNNAGMGSLGPVLETAPSTLQNTVDLNVAAPVMLARAIAPGMLDRAAAAGARAGLINVSSSAAFAPLPNFAAYAASKAFLLSFSEALREELRGRPIDVLTLCPGATKSAFGARAGFSGGQLPFAAEPDAVARAAMKALGRLPTLLTGPEGLALGPAALGRQLFAGALGVVTGRLARRSGAEGG